MFYFFFQAEDGIRDLVRSRGLGDVYKRQIEQGEELVKIAKEKKLKFQVGHIERFNPGLLSLETFISDPMFIQSDRLSQFNPRGTDAVSYTHLTLPTSDLV